MAANFYHRTSKEIPLRHPQLLIHLRNHLLDIVGGYTYTEGEYLVLER